MAEGLFLKRLNGIVSYFTHNSDTGRRCFLFIMAFWAAIACIANVQHCTQATGQP